jgi:uncharacterized RDD family membrane protein YckC
MMPGDATMPGYTTMSGNALFQDEYLTHGVLSRRVIAWIVDLMIIVVLGWTAWWSLLALGAATFGLALPLMVLLPLIPFCYHLSFLASPLAATPGQAMMGLIVLRDFDLGRPLPAQAVVSTLCFYATIMLGVIWLAVAVLTVRRRTVHDMLAGLVVVRRRALLAPTTPGWGMAGGFPHA